jgi:hypothetical protein
MHKAYIHPFGWIYEYPQKPKNDASLEINNCPLGPDRGTLTKAAVDLSRVSTQTQRARMPPVPESDDSRPSNYVRTMDDMTKSYFLV